MLTAEAWLGQFGLAELPKIATYDYHRGPCAGVECSLQEEVRLNCQFLAHVVLQLLGKNLPLTMRSAELFRKKARLNGRRSPKQKILRSVEAQEADVGDLFFFARNPYTGNTKTDEFAFHRQLHVAVCIQPATDLAKTQLIHAHRWTQTEARTLPGQAINVWTLEDFWQSTRYSILYGVRRPTV